jgi:hypothetical protein
MSGKTLKKQNKSSGILLDIFVVIFCLSGVAVSLFLFQRDLFTTLRSLSVTPAGIVSVRYNTVQRRLSDRVVWDRLFEESPVYDGDLIRIARLSGATLNIDDNEIELSENTLIRIQKETGRAQIELFSGGINVASGRTGGTIAVSIGERVVQSAPGTAFSAVSGEDGVVLRVTEGAARIIQDGRIYEAPAGTIIAHDAQGGEVLEPMAAVTRPRPNARFLKTESQLLNVDFAWARVNLRNEDTLRLEIAEDRNFSRITQAFENLDSKAAAAVDSGLWHWRLSFEDKVLAAGRIVVTDAPSPALLSPADGQKFFFSGARPEIQFRWSEVNEAAFYQLEVSDRSDFLNPKISLNVQGTFFVSPNFDEGNWYWRVLPVFPSVYEGNTRFSSVSSFSVEQGGNIEESTLSLPQTDSMVFPDEELTAAEPVSQFSEPPPPLRLTLLSPAQDASIPGLTALRQPTEFRWSTAEDVASSRFVLSRQADPARGRPEIDISNPSRTVTVNRLGEGVWYWTVTAISRDGRIIAADAPRQLNVQAVPLLPAPQNRMPAAGYRIGAEELRSQRNINFSWSRVEGANAYILSILSDSFPRRQIFQTSLLRELRYTFDDFILFDNGTYIWQVEAVFYNSGGVIEQRGQPGENSFVIDVPRPGRVQTRDMGVIYGN